MNQVSSPKTSCTLHGFFVVIATFLALSWPLHARDQAAFVGYSPVQQTVEGNMPFASTYTLAITAPAGITGPTTCLLVVNPTTIPIGDAATALTYVKFTDSLGLPITQVTFPGAGQTVSVKVVVTFPLLNLGAITSATFSYTINAIPLTGVGTWPMGGAAQPSDVGSAINATASLPPPPATGGPTPIVNITSPDDSTAVPTFSVTGFPATIPLTFTSTVLSTDNTFAVASVDASAAGATVTVDSTTGIGTMNATSSGSITVSGPGTYLVQANARNSAGTGSDTAQFKVAITGANPPTVAITTTPPGGSPVPLNGQTFSFSAPQTGININVGFNAAVAAGSGATLANVTATLDNVPFNGFTGVSLGGPTATGSTALVYLGSGPHTLTVTTTDSNGLTATTTANYTVVYTAPTPQITITKLGSVAGQVTASYTIPTGSTTIDIPFTFLTTTTGGFTISSVTGSAGTLNVSVTGNNPALPSAGPVTTDGKLVGVGPGSYTLVATGTSAGISATASVSFTVKPAVVTNTPPTVAITPPLASSYTIVTSASGEDDDDDDDDDGGSGGCGSGTPALNIPLNFVGTSTTTGAVITKLTASLDGKALTVTSTTLNQKVATGNATLVVSTAGSHLVTVTATDAYGVATATASFTVTIVQGKNICGLVYFDADFDGVRDCTHFSRWSGGGEDDRGCYSGSRTGGEFGLSGLTVKLLNSVNAVVATKKTGCDGTYCFTGIGPGTYVVSVTVPAGFGATTLSDRSVTVASSNVTAPDIGLGLKFSDIKNMKANGCSATFWKGNLDRTISGKSTGTSVSSAQCTSYTKSLGCLALDDYDGLSAKSASACMGSTSTKDVDQLSKELVTAEYNYANGAYIGGSKTLTYCFLWWGEHVHTQSTSYNSTYRLWARDWFKAYNNSGGGLCSGPSS